MIKNWCRYMNESLYAGTYDFLQGGKLRPGELLETKVRFVFANTQSLPDKVSVLSHSLIQHSINKSSMINELILLYKTVLNHQNNFSWDLTGSRNMLESSCWIWFHFLWIYNVWSWSFNKKFLHKTSFETRNRYRKLLRNYMSRIYNL